MSRRRSDQGFTIVEALVALAVFAMAGVALVNLQAHSLRTLSEVETRALADLEAQNRLTELVAARVRPGIGDSDESIDFGGRRWRVHVTVAATADAATQRISVSVAAGDGGPVQASAHAFVAASEDGA